ncbi:PfkB family carbohydrate kinase [Arthrobacter sp. B2a2-09]|uniref:PfkB family carbohydrate kinase n=1 Tax=Arthrobacter sp. B2a2-09 TaxID=2952822 RepID=UPI0022CD2F9D|nr:PfkB family carbohydrate kinase [Arthrobacter sp. B2a2-09]MCZ9884482.1 PfkB family carbohydrate kinase [Arthrobacter sp. B2a2-09]
MPIPSTLTVLGSLNVDLTCRVHRLPSPGETIGGGNLSRQAGGKGGNQAAAAARLAGAARMVGAVGADPDGRLLTEALDRAGVDISAVGQVSSPTGTALIVIDSDGENQIAVAPGANAVVSLERADFSDGVPVLAQLEIAVDTVLEAARRTTGFFALNAAPAQALPAELLERCDLVIVNESEYELIPELRNAKRVAVTYGAGGASMYAQGIKIAHAPATKTSVVNSVGAGDAFCAALVLALVSGLDEESSLAAACAVGAAAVASELSQPEFERLEHYVGRRSVRSA